MFEELLKFAVKHEVEVNITEEEMDKVFEEYFTDEKMEELDQLLGDRDFNDTYAEFVKEREETLMELGERYDDVTEVNAEVMMDVVSQCWLVFIDYLRGLNN